MELEKAYGLLKKVTHVGSNLTKALHDHQEMGIKHPAEGIVRVQFQCPEEFFFPLLPVLSGIKFCFVQTRFWPSLSESSRVAVY